MKKLIYTLIFLLVANLLSGQDRDAKKFGIKFSGFVKNDFFWDSRQTVAAREGHFHLWPDPVLEDLSGNDLNGQSSFNFLAIQSRMKVGFTGPDVMGAKLSAAIEGDFFAQANANINLLRLRHAFVKLNWEHLEVLTGQYWNPLFVTSCFPGTVSFNTGTPLQSFARNPQLRVSYQSGNLTFMGALLAQRDFTNVGAMGTNSEYLRNSASPDMHLQVHYGTSNEEGMNILAGAGIAYKTIAPRINSTGSDGSSYAVKERVGGITAIAFAKLSTKAVTVKIQGRYGENMSDVLAISGYGVTEVVDPATGELSYTPFKGATFWADVHSNGNPQVGLFGGVHQNMGSKKALDASMTVYGRALNIRSLMRVSPRIIYNINKFRLALELEYTSAAYGAGFDEYYVPNETTAANNLRALLAVYYFF